MENKAKKKTHGKKTRIFFYEKKKNKQLRKLYSVASPLSYKRIKKGKEKCKFAYSITLCGSGSFFIFL